MKGRARLSSDRRGAAAAEMALVTPLLLVILFGAVELGNYFYNEHIVVKAVRDGARFAASCGKAMRRTAPASTRTFASCCSCSAAAWTWSRASSAPWRSS